MAELTPAVVIEPRSWAVEVDGEKLGTVVLIPQLYGPAFWIAFHGPVSKDIGRFDTKDEAIAAVLAYEPPKVCPTCHQVVA